VDGHNYIKIQNSLIIGAITPNDCSDIVDPTTINVIYAQTAIPSVSATSFDGEAGGRSGFVFPFISSGDNMMPRHPWTNIDAYPCSESKTEIEFVLYLIDNIYCRRWFNDSDKCYTCIFQ
jgi:hypothetical protein